MSGQSKIRWRESDDQELKRLQKNYNAKIARERKKLLAEDKRYEAAKLPRPKGIKELRAEIKTRADFNRVTADMQHFNKTSETFRMSANTRRSLTATVRDFDKKVDRLRSKAKTQGEKAALPEKISVNWFIKNASSEEELKKMIQTQKGFLRRGAEKLTEFPDTKNNIKITTWQKETMEQKLVEINEARAQELKRWRETEVNYGGKKAGYTQGEIRADQKTLRMDQGVNDHFIPMKLYNWSTEYPDVKEKYRLMLREGQEGYWDKRTELARINYLEKLKEVTKGSEAGRMIYDKVSKLPLDEFRRKLDAEELFEDVYALEAQARAEAKRSQLVKIWQTWSKKDDKDDKEQAFLDAMEKIN